jgi:hypothetical protein
MSIHLRLIKNIKCRSVYFIVAILSEQILNCIAYCWHRSICKTV